MEDLDAAGSDLLALRLRVEALERSVAALARVAVPVASAALAGRRPDTETASAPPPPLPLPSAQSAAEAPVPAGPSSPFAAALPMLAPAAPAVPAKTLEDRLGSQVFNLIGIVALIVGSAWALKLAIEHGYLGPVARVLIGLVAGAGLVLWSERFRRNGLPAFSYSLKAVGTGVLYLSLWASFQLYHLLPAVVALIAMILVTAWNAFMAWSQDSELLAAYALFGGFITPLLLSTGGNHETFLFTYIGAVALAMVLLVRRKPWFRLLVPAFAGIVLFFIGWYSSYFHRAHDAGIWDGESTETALFALLFFAIFALATVRGWRPGAPDEGKSAEAALSNVLLPLGNAAFLGLALYSVFQDSGNHGLLAWLMVGLAALFLLLMRVQRTALAGAMQLAMAVVFLTVAIPLKASGHTLTTAWLVEGLILFWASTRFDQEALRTATLLRGLSVAGYALGLASLLAHWAWAEMWSTGMAPGFFNANLGSAIIAVATLVGAVWIGLRDSRNTFPRIGVAALLAIDFVGVLLTSREVGSTWVDTPAAAAFRNASFATALVGLAILAATAWVGYRLAQRNLAHFQTSESLAGITLVGFNLLTILTVEREIGALWSRSDANLQRSLAISGFLMLYAAGLLAAGFWRRSSFVRWQALVLLLFTVCKVFLYDTGSLSAGYRVASFMGLGAVLMGVSYAYQKDWLGLRAATPLSGAAAASDEVRG